MWQETQDKDKWNKLVSMQSHAPFLQSWVWGDFQMDLGREVKRLNYNDEIFAQIIKMPLAAGKFYWYIPHGPIVLDKMELDRILGEGGALFLRVDPLRFPDHPLTPSWVQAGELPHDTPPPLLRRGQGGGFIYVPSTQPQCARILDLTKTEAEILAGMHQKTRYNINLAERKGVDVGAGNVGEFLRLNHETKKRDQFTSHDDTYYQKMIKALTGDCQVKIWQASFAGQALASAIIIYFGDTATYAHGASSNAGRNLMAPHLLHWEIIQDAKQHGFKFYDFGGVNPEEANHPAFKKSWQGITRFKQGFGGEVVCYPSSFDLIYHSTWYRLYRLLKSLKSLLV